MAEWSSPARSRQPTCRMSYGRRRRVGGQVLCRGAENWVAELGGQSLARGPRRGSPYHSTSRPTHGRRRHRAAPRDDAPNGRADALWVFQRMRRRGGSTIAMGRLLRKTDAPPTRSDPDALYGWTPVRLLPSPSVEGGVGWIHFRKAQDPDRPRVLTRDGDAHRLRPPSKAWRLLRAATCGWTFRRQVPWELRR